MFSAFNPSKWSSWGFSALLKGLTSVVDTSCQSRDSNPQPWVTSGFKSNALSIRPRLPPWCTKPIYIYIYIYAFSRRFYPKRLTFHSSFYILSALAFPGNRTHDLGIASAMLYQLSYRKAISLYIHRCS